MIVFSIDDDVWIGDLRIDLRVYFSKSKEIADVLLKPIQVGVTQFAEQEERLMILLN